MKTFWKYVLIVIFFYMVGVGASMLIDGIAIKDAFLSPYALCGLVISALVCLLSNPKKKETKSFAVGKTQSGEKLSQYYDAKWVTKKELQTNPNFMFNTFSSLPSVKKSGIVIRNEVVNGKLEVNMYDPIHTLVIGTTGSGKTTDIIDPAIRILSHTGQKPCLVVTDPKGELYRNHVTQLKKEGYRIISIDLREPFASSRWNPMENSYDMYHKAMNIESEVKIHNGGKPSMFKLKETSNFKGEKTWYEYNGYAYGSREQLVEDLKSKKQALVSEALMELKEIATNICPINENKQDTSWDEGARNFIYGIMVAMLEDSLNPELGMTKEKFNPYNLAKITAFRDDDTENPFTTLRDYCAGRDKFSPVSAQTSTAINNAQGTTRSYMGIVNSSMEMFQDPGIQFLTSKSDVKFDDFVAKPTALFIKVPDEKVIYHGLATMCISQLYKKLVEIASTKPKGELPRYVYFLLDEFANLPKIEKMDTIITVARGRKIYFELVVQSYPQLDIKYGEKAAKTIKDNCNIHIFLGSNDQATKDEFSKRCGEVSLEIENVTESKGEKKEQGTSKTTSKQVVTRPLIGPYELGLLPRDTGIVSVFKQDPIKVNFTPYYRTAEFDKSTVEEGYVPSLSFDEESIYYDIKARNAKVLKKSNSGFDPFSF